MQMSKMTIIQLLNKIANGEKVPKKIKYKDWLYEFEKDCNDYLCQYDSLLYRGNDDVKQFLNDKVEILEEEKQETKAITKKDFETLGYACGEIQKAFTNGWTKSLENKPLKEANKIPEKLKIEQDALSSNYYIKNEFGTQCYLTKHSKIIADKINEILDYLESEGK
jgi:hypothetical protein